MLAGSDDRPSSESLQIDMRLTNDVCPESSTAALGPSSDLVSVENASATFGSPDKSVATRLTTKGGLPGARRKSGAVRRTVFISNAREMSTGPFSFLREILTLRKTVFLRIVPQIVLAAAVGLAANIIKLAYCVDNVASNEQCDVTFNQDGHLGVSVVLSILLLCRANLAYDRYDSGKAAIGQVYSGIRNLNVAFCAFLRVPTEHESGLLSPSQSAARSARLSRDRVELLRQGLGRGKQCLHHLPVLAVLTA